MNSINDYISIYKRPQYTEKDVYGAMFAVSSYSKSLPRSMEIITYLNTSTDIRTILQYGVEGIHWEYEDEETKDTIKILSDDYQMDIQDTGNVYMTYPGEGISMEYWEQAKKHNLDSQVSPYFMFDGPIVKKNKMDAMELAEFSASVKERLDAASSDEIDAVIKEIKEECKENSALQDLLDDTNNEDSFNNVYNIWHGSVN